MQKLFRQCLAVAVWLCCLGWPQENLLAQDAPPPKPRQRCQHEVGLNATALLDKILRFQGDSSTVNPYLLTYRLSHGHFGLRLGAGGTHHFNRATQEGFRDAETEKRSGFDARLGVDYRARFGRRFAGTFGLDAVGKWRFNQEINDSGFDVVTRTDQSDAWGGGPAVSLTFWLTPRLGVATEAAFYLLYGKAEHARNFKNFPELDDEIFRNRTEDLVTILPSSLFLIYHF